MKPRRFNLNRRLLMIVAGIAVLAALALGGVAIAGSTGVFDDGDAQLTGPSADQAKAAALKITGGGKANAVERDSEDGATYEVEVTRPDGKTVDVRLDASYNRVAVEGDSEEDDGVEQEGQH
jgi:hypothetical protein